MSELPQIRVVVRLPYNRPENAPANPPSIEWTPEKADILWKVIEKSRSRDNTKTDWKSLAERLQVPLPYLLYRVHTRFQEELRGLNSIVTPSTSPTAGKEEFPFNSTEGPSQTVVGRAASRMGGAIGLSGSTGRNSTPLGIRARLSSLGANSPRPKRASSSSTLTLHGGPRQPLRPPTPSSSESSSDSELDKEEEILRKNEEQAHLDKQLRDLQERMTSDALGLVTTSRKGKGIDRGRVGLISPLSIGISGGTNSSRSGSQSLSSTSSSQNSIPDIPSPPPESQPHSPTSRHMSPTKSVSPLSHSNRRYTHLDGWSASEHSSSQGSRASSSGFSDLASDAGLSASELASALESNIRGTRFSAFAPSRLHR